MSSYVCNRETFIDVLEAWRRNGDALRRLPEDDETANAWRAIVSANVEAVRNRYPNAKDMWNISEDEFIPPKLNNNWRFSDKTNAELFEAIQEYQYQVSDADEYHHLEGFYKCQWVKNQWLREFFGAE